MTPQRFNEIEKKAQTGSASQADMRELVEAAREYLAEKKCGYCTGIGTDPFPNIATGICPTCSQCGGFGYLKPAPSSGWTKYGPHERP